MMLILVVMLPVLAVALVTYIVTIVTTPDLLPLWAALPVGFVLGVVGVVFGVVTSGSDIMDVIVPSTVIIVISLLLLPSTPRLKA
ncbi:MAG TPA: hypothetical protein VF627_00640 [Abditibacterium sp.]